MLVAVLAGSHGGTWAAAPKRVCTKSCSKALRECVSGAKQERATLRGACTDGAGGRACRQRASVTARAVAGACRALHQQCRSCCQAGATSCDQPQVARDQSRATSALVTTAGGSVTATGADGTTYTLDVPAGALPDDETIALEPITKIGGFPLGAGILAGVHAEPSGLQLVKPATLTITMRQAPAGRVIGFLYDGEGADFGTTLAFMDGPAIRLRVTHFSGFGAGAENSPELAAIQSRSVNVAAEQFVGEIFALAGQSVGDRNRYLDVFRRWYRQIVRPELGGAVGSDPRLRQALRDYDHWLYVLQQAPGAFGLPLDFDTPMKPEQGEALGLIATALRDAIARADARCLAQHSLAEAETALEWQVIADAADVDTLANALDLDTVLEGLCVEAHYDDVTFPSPPPLDIPSVLRARVGLAFIDGVAATGDTMEVQVTPHGVQEGPPIGDTDAAGIIEFSFTPLGDRELRLDVHACGHVPGRRRLKRVCQDAFVIRGLAVEPAQATLPPAPSSSSPRSSSASRHRTSPGRPRAARSTRPAASRRARLAGRSRCARRTRSTTAPRPRRSWSAALRRPPSRGTCSGSGSGASGRRPR